MTRIILSLEKIAGKSSAICAGVPWYSASKFLFSVVRCFTFSFASMVASFNFASINRHALILLDFNNVSTPTTAFVSDASNCSFSAFRCAERSRQYLQPGNTEKIKKRLSADFSVSHRV
eukprot:2272360-Rhodomonas_salina.4